MAITNETTDSENLPEIVIENDSADETTPPTEGDAQADTDDGGTERPEDPRLKRANKEAANYRTQLRETQTANEQLAERLTKAHTEIVQSAIGDRLNDPSDLWTYGTELADLLDENGSVDIERVRGAIDELLTSRPYLAPTRVQIPSVSMPDTGSANWGNSSSASWNDALNPKP